MPLPDGTPRDLRRLLHGDELRRQMERNLPIAGSIQVESLLGFLQYDPCGRVWLGARVRRRAA